MSDEERNGSPLANLPAEEPPPAGLEARLAARLRAEGQLAPPRRWPWIAIAAALGAVAMLWFVQPRHVEPRHESAYILLLYEPAAASSKPSRAVEYGNWARSMRPHVVGGEELGPDVGAFAPAAPVPGTSATQLAGYFLLEAPNDFEAERIARSCPHLRYGGRVDLRRIVRHR